MTNFIARKIALWYAGISTKGEPMREVEPTVFFVGETGVNEAGIQAYLAHVGAPEWKTNPSSAGELLIEVNGRMCYRSFKPGLNPNVSKIREGNDVYIGNIIKQQHGSVIEHATASFIFADVSRVFTHELVRHRVGTAMSQESLRFVRLDEIRFWFPAWAKQDPELMERGREVVQKLEEFQLWLAKHFNLDAPGLAFHVKKAKTSFMRRFAPDGLATAIGFTANHRAWRHMIEYRTAEGAEEEIRLVFDKVARIMKEKFPNLYADFQPMPVEGSDVPFWKPAHSKV